MVKKVRKAGEAHLTWRRFKKHKMAMVGAVITLLWIFIAIIAPFIAPNDPYEVHMKIRLLPPSRKYPLGTDELGRCILSRIMHGAVISIQVGVIAVSLSIVFGVLFGLVAVYFGGLTDMIIMRIMDILLSFPGILMALMIICVLGPGVNNVMIAVGLWGIPEFARLIRGVGLSIKEEVYIEAARAIGSSDLRIMLREMLPNCFPPIVVLATLHVPYAILSAAGLSFLGMGAQPPSPEWGLMLSGGRTYLESAPWVTTFPGLAILFTVLGFNLLGDGLRDALDPRLKL